jgi:hypothetical protein
MHRRGQGFWPGEELNTLLGSTGWRAVSEELQLTGVSCRPIP